MSIRSIASPKQRSPSKVYRDDWYPYYAGYSPLFVESVLEKYGSTGDRIIDPWSGSGTTALVGSRLGFFCTGIDINPVMTIVSKARNSSYADYERSKLIFDDMIKNYESFTELDGLLINRWFDTDSSSTLLGMSNYLMAFSGINNSSLYRRSPDNSVSLILLAIFRTTRLFSSNLSASNPSWIKVKPLNKISINSNAFILKMRQEFYNLEEGISRHMPKEIPAPYLDTMSSEKTEFYDNSFDFIIGSPPYATRIDYSVKTAVELALLGFTEDNFSQFRNSMMGTTTINGSPKDQTYTDSIYKVLDLIKSHTSKASSTYYYKTFNDYFYKLQTSIFEISRIIKPQGKACIVVQDSYYKDVHIDLKKITIDVLSEANFSNFEFHDFTDKVTMRNINTKANSYKASVKPVESVVIAKRSTK